MAAEEDANVARGADNLVQRCLELRKGETVAVLVWNATEVADAVERAVERAGGIARRVALEPFTADAERGGARALLGVRLGPELSGASATVLLSSTGMPTSLSLAAIEAAKAAGARHLHLLGVAPRLLAQSVRADPDRLAEMNDRLAALLQAPARVRVTSDAGTALDVALGASYPFAAENGRPRPGTSQNLPSGFVYVHPAQIQGTFVADRGLVGTGVPQGAIAARRTPATFTIAAGRVTSASCARAEAQALIERYLASHPDAGRVGLVLFPTNYLVRSEIGVEVQDELLPGVNVCLGFSEANVTRAPYDAPVQLRLLARRLTVEVRGQRVVAAGRFADALVEGIDPFR
jgi:leucyl aminopeptidase (aminopeptidase T)